MTSTAMKRRIPSLLACLAVLGPLGGCFGGGGDGGGPQPTGASASQEQETEKADKGERRQVEKESKPTKAEYSYNPIGKRDPFRSFTSIEVVRPDSIVASELQSWELDQLNLVAILWGIDAPVAMVEDPKGKGHVIRHGDLIGKKWGKVTQIRSDEVIVTEEFRDPIENRPITNEYSMKLPDPYAESTKR